MDLDLPGMVPSGTYRCRIDEVRVEATQTGDEIWELKLGVVDGPHCGNLAAWDRIIFSTRGRPRARQVLRAFGVGSKQKITPTGLEGMQAMVQVQRVAFTSPSGEHIVRNEVPYDGYSKIS